MEEAIKTISLVTTIPMEKSLSIDKLSSNLVSPIKYSLLSLLHKNVVYLHTYPKENGYIFAPWGFLNDTMKNTILPHRGGQHDQHRISTRTKRIQDRSKNHRRAIGYHVVC